MNTVKSTALKLAMEFDPRIEELLLQAAKGREFSAEMQRVFDFLHLYAKAIQVARAHGVGHEPIAKILGSKATEGGLNITRRAVKAFCDKFLNESGKSKAIAHRERRKKDNKSTVTMNLKETATLNGLATKDTPNAVGKTPEQRANPAFRQNESEERPL